MKCCKCQKEVSMKEKDNQHPPPKWFSYYNCTELKALICAECLSVPENKEWWRKQK